jgi:hypothetical protein
MILVALMVGLTPAAALAHGPGGHPAPTDPPLHVDPSLEECEVHFAPELTQEAFGRFVREFGSVSAFRMMAPPTMMGRGGVAVALEYLSFTIEDRSDAWNDTFSHPDAYHELGEDQAFPKLRVRVGVGERWDLGAFYTRNPQANYGWAGFETRYGALRQSETMPVSMAVRGAYTRTLFVDDMDMHAITTDVAVGRTFWNMLTPYVDVGGDIVMARETASTVDLHQETQYASHAIAGVELRYWHVALGAEAKWSDVSVNSYQVQIAALF